MNFFGLVCISYLTEGREITQPVISQRQNILHTLYHDDILRSNMKTWKKCAAEKFLIFFIWVHNKSKDQTGKVY